jgi:hypothetical protein
MTATADLARVVPTVGPERPVADRGQMLTQFEQLEDLQLLVMLHHGKPEVMRDQIAATWLQVATQMSEGAEELSASYAPIAEQFRGSTSKQYAVSVGRLRDAMSEVASMALLMADLVSAAAAWLESAQQASPLPEGVDVESLTQQATATSSSGAADQRTGPAPSVVGSSSTESGG